MAQNYTGERYDPGVPFCGRAALSLTFDGRWLKGLGMKSAVVLPAVSGKPNEKNKFDYSPARQAIAYKGPIPEGEYWIQPDEMWENNVVKSALGITPRTAWGNFRITIHPYPATKTHKRGGFFIHGGQVAGSAGCIDLTGHMDKFVKELTKELEGLPKCYIPLTVRYPKR